jgi:hypothetical protein
MIDFQSPASDLRPCPSGTFENSQQHARVIYDWVNRPLPTQSPEGTTEVALGLKCRTRIYRLARRTGLLHRRNPPSRFPKANQGYPNLFKGFWKKYLFYE